MKDLLEFAVDAHGGMDRWNQLISVEGRFAIGGAIWGFKGVPGVFGDIDVALDLHTERVTIDPVAGPDTHTVFADGRMELRSASGEVVQAVDDPKDAMARLAYDALWTALDAAYFASEAWWTYLTAPFLFTYSGFRVDDVDSHTAEQFFHFDDAGLLFRHSYTVDILDGASGANYPSDYQTIDGIAVPMVRRIYGYDEHLQKTPAPVLVTIDINALQFR